MISIKIKRFLLILCCISFTVFAFKPEAKAFDPVTASIAASIALEVASAMAPYIIKGLQNGGRAMVEMGADVFDIFRLPLGFFQVTAISPWYFYDGLYNLAQGLLAPLRLSFHALILPLKVMGIGI